MQSSGPKSSTGLKNFISLDRNIETLESLIPTGKRQLEGTIQWQSCATFVGKDDSEGRTKSPRGYA